MKTLRCFLRLSVLAACLLVTVSAADYDGYLVEIEKPVRLLAASMLDPVLPEMKEVSAPLGVYQVEDAAAVETLRARGMLLHAEPNYIVTLDDPPAADALLLDGDNPETQWYETPLEMEHVRKNGVTGNGVRVGVVDSGIFKEHEEFQGVKVLPGTNYCVPEDDPARTDVSDAVGHGTFVSGLIIAAENNAGIIGLAPGVELVPLKCFESKSASIANIAAAIQDGVDTWKCQVLNLSFGLEKDSSTLRKAIEYVEKAGVLMVAAAGNLTRGAHNDNGDPLNYPAAYPQVIGVGAVGSNLSVSSFSYRNESVEVSAPGQNLRGPDTTGTGDYTNGYGTSYSAPIVTAAAALALSLRPDLNAADFRKLLQSTVRDLGPEGYDTSYGYGLLQVGALCAAVDPERFQIPETFGDPESLFQQVEATRKRLAGTDPVPMLLAVAYNQDGQCMAILDVSPADDRDISEEMFQIPDAASWRLISFDRVTFAPAESAVEIPAA
ncbi:MAG: S8 family serine peptidase [Oscillibacter sp.]|nr:S8 family serine peptidase [Oscillibacter sp.]